MCSDFTETHLHVMALLGKACDSEDIASRAQNFMSVADPYGNFKGFTLLVYLFVCYLFCHC